MRLPRFGPALLIAPARSVRLAGGVLSGLTGAVLVHVNGRLVPEEEAKVSVFDRGFMYGDGLFETVRAYGSRLFLWEAHLARWRAGAATLGIVPPVAEPRLKAAAEELIRANGATEAILRIHLSRGAGKRGYSPRGADAPTLVLSVHPASKQERLARVIVARQPFWTRDPLGAVKHTSQLPRILARAEGDAAGADEALLTNEAGELLEGTSANLFWFEGETLATPPLVGSLLPGTTRAFVLELARAISMPVRERAIAKLDLAAANGAFLTSAGVELWEIGELDGQPMARSPEFARLQKAYQAGVERFVRDNPKAGE